MRVKSLIVGLGVLLPACGDDGITGFWYGELPDTDVALTVEEREETVMGSVEIDGGQMQSEARGSVEKEWVELTFPQLEGGVHFEAGLQGEDQMTGTWTTRGVGEKLTMKRVR